MEFNQARQTQVKIRRSPQRLQFEIPPGEYWPFTSRLGLVVIVVGLVWLLFMSLPTVLMQPRTPMIAVLISGLVIGMLYWELRPTFVEFEKNHFCIYKCVANRTVTLSRGSTDQIQNVFHTLKQFNRGQNTYQQRVVVIQTRFEEHSFGGGLSWDECEWLANEIQNWLNSCD